jgi:uncharacterized membrane protein
VIFRRVWFVAFHQIFFTSGSWTFNTSDTLIRHFPEHFWYDAALTISGLSLAGGLAIALIGRYVQLRNLSGPMTRPERFLAADRVPTGRGMTG